MNNIIWKQIEKCPNYLISNTGEIKNVNGRILKQQTDRHGYRVVNLPNKDVRKKYLVHRLVAFAFLKNEGNNPIINHKNGVSIDNRIENLEWCSISDNAIHAKDILKTRNVISYKYAKKILEQNKNITAAEYFALLFPF